jgi:hypothetical protein
MYRLTDFPLVTFAVSIILLWASAKLGTRYAHHVEDVREDFGVILTGTLTLLGLIVGFTFSMAVSRYDQRKLYEEEEANAIGTEYVRADLLPAADAGELRKLLREYLDQRILFYGTRNRKAQQEIAAAIAQLQDRLWTTAKSASLAQQTPVTALVVSGMNDVLNSQGYTKASWLNRIPRAAWALLAIIAISANVMLGLYMRRGRSMGALSLVLPTIISVAFLLIADIDAPRGGLIHVEPENLMSLAESLGPQ